VSISSKLGIESVGMLLALIFYAIVGILCFAVFALVNLPHLAIIGIFSLVTAYGLFKKRSWALWIVVMLFFVGTAFSLNMLIVAFGKELLLDLSMIGYLILTWVSTAYVASRRRKLES